MAGINDIAKAAGLKDSDVQMVFAQILELVKQDETNPDGSIKGPMRVQIKGFGSFTRSTLKERTIFSPVLQGGQALVAARDVLRFKPSPHTKQYLNGEVEAPANAVAAPAAKPAVAKPAAPVAKPTNGVKPAPPAAKPAVAKPAPKPVAPPPPPPAEEEPADDENPGEFTGDD